MRSRGTGPRATVKGDDFGMARDRPSRYGEKGRFWHGEGQGFPPRYGERRILARRRTGPRTTGTPERIETRRSLLLEKADIKIPS